MLWFKGDLFNFWLSLLANLAFSKYSWLLLQPQRSCSFNRLACCNHSTQSMQTCTGGDRADHSAPLPDSAFRLAPPKMEPFSTPPRYPVSKPPHVDVSLQGHPSDCEGRRNKAAAYLLSQTHYDFVIFCLEAGDPLQPRTSGPRKSGPACPIR